MYGETVEHLSSGLACLNFFKIAEVAEVRWNQKAWNMAL